MILHGICQMTISVKMDPLARVKDHDLSSIVLGAKCKFEEGKGVKPGEEALVPLVSSSRVFVARRHIAGPPSAVIYVFAEGDQAGGIAPVALVAFHADP